MNRILLRLVACLLVPCFLAEPAGLMGQAWMDLRPTLTRPLQCFSVQAIPPTALPFCRSSFRKAMTYGFYLATFAVLIGGSVSVAKNHALVRTIGSAGPFLPVIAGAALLAATVHLKKFGRRPTSNGKEEWASLITRLLHGDLPLSHLRRGHIRLVWKKAFPFMLIDSSLFIGSSIIFERLANEASTGFSSGSWRLMLVLSILRLLVPFMYKARATAERLTKIQQVNFVRSSRSYILQETQGKIDINHLPSGLGEQLLYNSDDLGIVNIEAPVYAFHYIIHFVVSAGLLAWQSWPVALAVIPGSLFLLLFLWPRYIRLQHLHSWIARLSGAVAARAETAHERSVLMMTRGNGLRDYAGNLLGHSFDRLRRFETSAARLETNVRGSGETMADFLFSALPEVGLFLILYFTGTTSIEQIVAITILTANVHHSVDMGLDLLRRCHIATGSTRPLLKFLPPNPSPPPLARELKHNGIHVQHIYYSVDGKSILEDISFDVRPGDLIEVRGESGAGKSILLGLAAGLYRPTPGPEGATSSLELGGLDPQEVNGNLKAGVYSGEGLFPDKSIGENLFPVKNRFPTQDEMRMLVNLANAPFIRVKWDQKVSTLSAGQKRRLRIAMALYRLLENEGDKAAITPRGVLFLDEPFEHLDKRSAERLEQSLQEIHSLGVTMIIINHHEERLHSIPHDIVMVENRGISSPHFASTIPAQRLLASAG